MRHASFGEGQIICYEAGEVVLLFGEVGYQTLSLEVALEEGLLEPLDP